MQTKPETMWLIILITVVLCACSQTTKMNTAPSSERTNTLHSIIPLDLNSLEDSHVDELKNSLWIDCLQALIDVSPQSRTSEISHLADPERGQRCSTLLTRASDTPRPKLLSREWLILDAHEYISPALKIDAKHSGFRRASRSLHHGVWRLKVKILRLTPDHVKFGGHQRHRFSIKGVPPPLAHWSDAQIERVSLTEWGALGLDHRELMGPRATQLSELSTPRVGQMLELELNRAAPLITRGGWALHLPLRFSAPFLRYTLTIHTPRGANVSHFGVAPNESSIRPHEHQHRWYLTSKPANLGGELYLTTTPTWASLHQWLWKSFNDERESYKRFFSQYLDKSALSYFLVPRSLATVHEWVRGFIQYTPRPYRPYTPISITQLLREKEGDCKDLSLFSQTILSTQGYRSFIALASTQALPNAALDTPSVGWFNHALLWLPSPSSLKLAKLASKKSPPVLDPGLSKYQWFDATSNNTGGEAPSSIQGQYVYVMLSSTEGVWIPISSQ